jgi:hypothetical protein
LSKRDLLTEITNRLELQFSKAEVKDGELIFIREYERDLVVAITTSDVELIKKFEER